MKKLQLLWVGLFLIVVQTVQAMQDGPPKFSLVKAIEKNEVENIRLFLQSAKTFNLHVDLDSLCSGCHYPPLILAVREESYEIVTMLLEAGAQVNAQDRVGNSALTHAMYCENEKVRNQLVDLFIEAGIDLELSGKWGGDGTALAHAISQGHHDIIDKLLKAGADPNEFGVLTGYCEEEVPIPSLLVGALTNKDIKLAQKLLSYGCSPNEKIRAYELKTFHFRDAWQELQPICLELHSTYENYKKTLVAPIEQRACKIVYRTAMHDYACIQRYEVLRDIYRWCYFNQECDFLKALNRKCLWWGSRPEQDLDSNSLNLLELPKWFAQVQEEARQHYALIKMAQNGQLGDMNFRCE